MKKKRKGKKRQCRRQEDGNERAKGELRGETKKKKKRIHHKAKEEER